jgi:hypothetical protein
MADDGKSSRHSNDLGPRGRGESATAEAVARGEGCGAEIACLPENFAFIGLRDATSCSGGGGRRRAGAAFLRATARELKLWILGGTINRDPRAMTREAASRTPRC